MNNRVRRDHMTRETRRVHLGRTSSVLKGVITVAAFAGCLTTERIASAFHRSCDGCYWPGGVASYYINMNSFTSGKLRGLALTSEQTRWWVNFAAGNWSFHQTAAAFDFVYAGDTTAIPVGCSGGNWNNENEVGVTNSCLEPGCMTLAQTSRASSDYFLETDLCVYGAAITWGITSPIPSSRKDLVGVLTHELGHALGLAHTPNTVMDTGSLGVGNTQARFPYGDDMDGAITIYGQEPNIGYWAKWDQGASGFSGWNTFAYPLALSNGVTVTTSAADGNVVVATGTKIDFSKVYFFRAPHPVPSSMPATWPSRLIVDRTRHAVGIAGTPIGWPPGVNSPGQLAVWSRERQTATSCPGYRATWSSNAFANLNMQTPTSGCLAHGPKVAYDPNSDHWVTIFVLSDTGSTQDEVFAQTSADGVTWGPAQDLGAVALDTPNVACALFSGCTMIYPRANIDSWIEEDNFAINASTGAIVRSTSINNHNRTPVSPAITVRNTGSGSDIEWFQSLTWGQDADLTKNTYEFYTSRSAGPLGSLPTTFNWVDMGTGSVTQSALGADSNGAMYLTTTDYH